MESIRIWSAVLSILIGITSGCSTPREPEIDDHLVTVTIHTSMGDISVAVDTVAAPATSANFLRYVDDRLYDNGSFFRTVHAENQPQDSIRIAVIQGGANRELSEQFFDPIELERTSATGFKHVDGAISMARGAPDTATDSFFFCIGDQPDLDFGGLRNPDGQGFAAFGSVLEGGDVIRRIQMSPHDEQSLNPPIEIVSIRRN